MRYFFFSCTYDFHFTFNTSSGAQNKADEKETLCAPPPCSSDMTNKGRGNFYEDMLEIDEMADAGDFNSAAKILEEMIRSDEKFTPQDFQTLGRTFQRIRNISREHDYLYGTNMSFSIFGSLEKMKNDDPGTDIFEEKEKSQIIEMIEEITAELGEGSNITKPSILAQSIRFADKEEVELTLPETVPEQDRPIKLNFGTYRGKRTNIAVLENSYKDMLPSPRDGISILESPIISVTFMESSSGATESNTYFSLKFKQKNHTEYLGHKLERKCVYLNTTTNTWLSNGCTTQLNTDKTCTCTCTHTTSFAVLLSPTPVTDHEGQEIVSYIMFVINTSFLILTFSLIAPFRKLRINKSVLNQLCLVLTLILGNTTFVVLSASSTVAVDDEGTPLLSLNAGCVTGVIISQYFFLSAFFWMGCIAWTFFNKIVRAVKTFGKPNKNYFRNCALLSWICPVIFPVASLLFSFIPNKGSDYPMPYVGANREKGVTHCWVEDPWRYIGFLVPAYFILLFNCVCFGMVARVIVKSVKVESEMQGLYKTAKAMMVAAVSIGLPWLVAGLAVGPVAGFMQYLFIVTTGIQGPLLFISLVILQEDTRNNTRQLIRKCLGRSTVASQDTAPSGRANSTSHTAQ